MQRGCHFGASGSDVFECRFRLRDYNDVPDVSGQKNIVAHDIKNKRKGIEKIKTLNEERGKGEEKKRDYSIK